VQSTECKGMYTHGRSPPTANANPFKERPSVQCVPGAPTAARQSQPLQQPRQQLRQWHRSLVAWRTLDRFSRGCLRGLGHEIQQDEVRRLLQLPWSRADAELLLPAHLDKRHGKSSDSQNSAGRCTKFLGSIKVAA